jgi:hypothetical protein
MVHNKDVRREDDNWELVNIRGRRNVFNGEKMESFHETDTGGASEAETETSA